MNLGALTKFLPWYGWVALAGGAAVLFFAGTSAEASWTMPGSPESPLPLSPTPTPGGGSPRPPGLAPVLKVGSTGPWVSYLQSQLGIGVTGDFDTATLAAVKTYQMGKGLGADGIVGAGTWGALGVTAAPLITVPPSPPQTVDDGSGWNEPGKGQDKPNGTDSAESDVADMSLLGALMVGVKQSNIETSKPLIIPDFYADTLKKYAAANPADGKMLLEALGRSPKFREGGWILDVQQGAAAITINDTIFFQPGAINNMENYIHELVHVYQGGHEDPATFFVHYFGESALEIWKRLIAGQPLNVMKSNPDEMQAYAVGERFQAWLQAGGAK